MSPENRNSLLLGNGSANTFPPKQTRATREERCFLWSALVAAQRYDKHISAAVSQQGEIEEVVFSVGAAPKLYNEDLTQYINEFEISTPQCPTRYCHEGDGDVPDIVVHKNVRLSDVIVSDILDSDHTPIVFHLLDHIRTRHL
jgi:hypothetical protein